MRRTFLLALGLLLTLGTAFDAEAQRKRGKKGAQQKQRDSKQSLRGNGENAPIGDENPLAIGDSGVAWYTTWETGLAEAKRSNRPIFFMSAATTCSGVPGVF